MALPIESDGERFERVATIFDTAGFLHSLGIRLEKVGINFLLPGRSGRLEARGRALRAGRRVIVCEAEVFGIESGERQLIAKLISTLTVLDERPFAVVASATGK